MDFHERVRKLRKERGLTLEALATRSELTKSYLSRVENRQLSPSINTLLKIARGLGVTMGELFEEKKQERPLLIIHANERKQVINDLYQTAFSLTFGRARKNMQPFFVTLHPNTEIADSFFQHAGEEFMFILEGDVKFVYGGEIHPLKAGDALYFDSNVPHRAIPTGRKKGTILVVIYSPQS